MTNKPMLSVEREVLESFAEYVADSPNAVMRARATELRALLDNTSQSDYLDSCESAHKALAEPAAQQQGEPSTAGTPEPARWERMSEMQGGTWWPCANKAEADQAVNCGWTVRPLYADRQPTGQRYSMHTVMIALERSKVRITLTSNQCYALAQSLNEDLQ